MMFNNNTDADFGIVRNCQVNQFEIIKILGHMQRTQNNLMNNSDPILEILGIFSFQNFKFILMKIV